MHNLFDKLSDDKKLHIFKDSVMMLDDSRKHHIKIKLAALANDGHLSEDTANHWVNSLGSKKWSIQETSNLIPANVDKFDWFAILNWLHDEYCDILGSDASVYVKLATKWFDSNKSKTFNYFYYVIGENF